MALHLRIGRRRAPLGHALPSLEAPTSLASFHTQRFADTADHAEDRSTHAGHHPDLRPEVSRFDREDPLMTRRPTRISTIHHEGGASCVTPSLCDC